MQRASSTIRRGFAQMGGGSKTAARVVPFDYAAEFPIEGRSGQLRESVINISPDGSYTAVAISYGFDQERGKSLGAFSPATPAPTTPPPAAPGLLTLDNFPTDALLDGVRVNPRFLPVVFDVQSTPDGLIATGYSSVPLTVVQLNNTQIFERVQPVVPIDFFLNIIDSATGRELQDQPTFSGAALGESTGRRPFRALAAPVHLDPSTSIRLQIVERTPNVKGTLFINLIGYHEFIAGCEPVFPDAGDVPLSGADRVIPFDYVMHLRLIGQQDRRVEDEIVVDGNFVASSISYGLQSDDTAISISGQIPPTTDLRAVRLNQLPIQALVEGFRIRPNMVRFAFGPGGLLNNAIAPDMANRVFETLNQPEAVSFRYSLFDSRLGRELQNQAIHNIAGLGSAFGERPFKRLAKPLRLEPSSTFRVTVEERFGRGELFVVLQGYRKVGAGGRR